MFNTAILASSALLLAGSVSYAGTPPGNDFKARVAPIQQSGPFHPTIPAGLYPLNAQFGQLPTNYSTNGDQWPCYGGGADCSSINSNGVVLGIPVYAWSLSACNNSAPPATPCGQIYFFYQDLTGDTTDDLILTVEVKQGSNYIFAKGPVNLGPDPYYDEDVVFSGDKAFGTQGQAGKGNGWCAGSNHTCVDPVAGVANGEAVIQVGPYEIKQKFTFNLQ
jgi:hypothetical protein